MDFLLPLLGLPKMPVKTLAKALGLVVALVPSHGAIARICTCSGYLDLEKHVEFTGWKGSVVILDQTIQELRFFYSHAFQLNGSLLVHLCQMLESIQSYLGQCPNLIGFWR